jgi:hypothetical protein
MQFNDALKILHEHQQWRLAKSEHFVEPKLLTEAIDVILKGKGLIIEEDLNLEIQNYRHPNFITNFRLGAKWAIQTINDKFKIK